MLISLKQTTGNDQHSILASAEDPGTLPSTSSQQPTLSSVLPLWSLGRHCASDPGGSFLFIFEDSCRCNSDVSMAWDKKRAWRTMQRHEHGHARAKDISHRPLGFSKEGLREELPSSTRRRVCRVGLARDLQIAQVRREENEAETKVAGIFR